MTRTTKWNSLISSLRTPHRDDSEAWIFNTGLSMSIGEVLSERSCQNEGCLPARREGRIHLDGQRQEKPAHAPCPPRAVSASLGAAIQYVKAATIMIAFAAAVVILLEGNVGDNAPSDGTLPN